MNSAYMLITGGLGGLGTAFAMECAHRGYNLLLVDRHPDADSVIDFLKQRFSIDIQYLSCNLADPDARKTLLEEIQKRQMVFSGLINVVGQEFEGWFLEKSRGEIFYMLQLNLHAMVDLTHEILAMRDETNPFLLVNVASLAAYFPMPYKALYAATKTFILNFSLALRKEIKDFGNVTVLCPGGLPTNAEAMKKIFLQGFWGKITAHDTATVARKTLDYVKRNKAVYTPGLPNKLLIGISRLLPKPWLAAYLSRRWSKKMEILDLWRITEKQRTQSEHSTKQ